MECLREKAEAFQSTMQLSNFSSSSYISACKSPRGIQIVGTSMFVIPRIPVNALL